MRNCIYQDKRTGKWYIKTKIKVGDKYKDCTIRGYESKKEADYDYTRAVEQWKREHNIRPFSASFKALFDEFVEYRALTNSLGTTHQDKSQYSTHYKIFGEVPFVCVLSPSFLDDFYKDVSSQDISSRKKYRLIKTMREITQFAYDRRYIDDTTLKDCLRILIKPKIDLTKKVEKRVIPKEHKKAVLSAINPKSNDLPMLSLFMCLGARLSEFLGILVEDVDLESGKINIRHQLLINGKLSNDLKTSNSYRSVPIPKDIVAMLNECIKNKKTTERLFKISHNGFRRRLIKYEDLAQVPHYATHEYRHTRCFELASVCKNIAEISVCAKMLGHSTSMFLNTYCSHIEENHEKEILSRLE